MAALPLRVLYALASLIAWVTFRVVPYRAEVVHENLKIAFPDASETELRDIMRHAGTPDLKTIDQNYVTWSKF